MNKLMKTGMVVCLAGAMMAAATGCGRSNKTADTKTESSAKAGTSEKKADNTQKGDKADLSKKQEKQKQSEVTQK